VDRRSRRPSGPGAALLPFAALLAVTLTGLLVVALVLWDRDYWPSHQLTVLALALSVSGIALLLLGAERGSTAASVLGLITGTAGLITQAFALVALLVPLS